MQGLQGTSYGPSTPPSERPGASREAEGTPLSWCFRVGMHLWLGSMSCLSTTERKIKRITTCGCEEHKKQKHNVKRKLKKTTNKIWVDMVMTTCMHFDLTGLFQI